MFVEKSPQEIEAMTAQEQKEYFSALNADKAAKLEALKKELKENATKDIENAITALRDEIGRAQLSQLETLEKALETQGNAIRDLMKSGKADVKRTLRDELEANKEALAAAMDKRVVIKTDVARTSITDSTIGMRIDGFGQISTQSNKMAGLFAKGSISAGMGGVVRYIDQASVTNNAAAVSENGLKPESAITWVEKTMALQKVAHNIPVSMEALRDIAQLETEINNMLLKYLDVKIDNYLWSGTGTAPQIKGIYTAATTYTAAASGITDANIFDLIVKVQANIVGSKQYAANYAIMNISDVNKMLLKKDSTNNYIVPPFVTITNGIINVNGITVIPSNSVTANTMLVGDFNFATLYQLGGTTIEVGRINSQFTENQVTIQAEQYLGLLVRSVHEDAFNKVTSISAALTTLAS